MPITVAIGPRTVDVLDFAAEYLFEAARKQTDPDEMNILRRHSSELYALARDAEGALQDAVLTSASVKGA